MTVKGHYLLNQINESESIYAKANSDTDEELHVEKK